MKAINLLRKIKGKLHTTSKKEKFKKLFMASLCVFFIIGITGCHKTEIEIDEEDLESTETRDYQMESKLEGTSWKFLHGTHWIMVFSFGYGGILYIAETDTKKNHNFYYEGTWKCPQKDVLDARSDDGTAHVVIMNSIGPLPKIEYLSGNTMKLKSLITEVTLTKVTYQGGNDNSGSGSSDAPYIVSFDFSATKNSITVKFMCSERPTSATIKYGSSENSISSSASATIAAKQVSATVKGLKAGTKYYFKCQVSNSNGSSTSDAYPAMTNY